VCLNVGLLWVVMVFSICSFLVIILGLMLLLVMMVSEMVCEWVWGFCDGDGFCIWLL